MGNKVKNKPLSPESIFEDAIDKVDPEIKSEELRLLVSGYMALKERQEKPVNTNELKSITSMIAYLAYKQGICETTIREVLMATFHVDTVQALPSSIYPEIIEYLVDLNLNETIN